MTRLLAGWRGRVDDRFLTRTSRSRIGWHVPAANGHLGSDEQRLALDRGSDFHDMKTDDLRGRAIERRIRRGRRGDRLQPGCCHLVRGDSQPIRGILEDQTRAQPWPRRLVVVDPADEPHRVDTMQLGGADDARIDATEGSRPDRDAATMDSSLTSRPANVTASLTLRRIAAFGSTWTSPWLLTPLAGSMSQSTTKSRRHASI